METRKRSVVVSVGLIALACVLGIGSRRFPDRLPWFVAAYAGDTLWATAAFFGIGLLLPGVSTWRVATLALALSASVEASQLYHAPWIDSIRRTTLGRLALGSDFVWSDLICYAVGVGSGVVIEFLARSIRAKLGR
jgi:hypothetical protein